MEEGENQRRRGERCKGGMRGAEEKRKGRQEWARKNRDSGLWPAGLLPMQSAGKVAAQEGLKTWLPSVQSPGRVIQAGAERSRKSRQRVTFPHTHSQQP
jgi:hypothetical protein